MIGFRIGSPMRDVPAALVERFADVPTANLGDCMERLFDGGAALKPMNPSVRMAGPALTVRVPPGDNLMVHKALDLARPGDIVVVDAGGQLSNAIVGDLMVLHAQTRRLGGLVIFGAVRDSATLREGRFPVFALGATPRGPYKNGPGEIGHPICIGGMVIEPGDIVVGDADGVIAIPLASAPGVLDRALALGEAEERSRVAIAAGTRDRSWIDETLRARGYTGPLS
jgi:RraA family protein